MKTLRAVTVATDRFLGCQWFDFPVDVVSPRAKVVRVGRYNGDPHLWLTDETPSHPDDPASYHPSPMVVVFVRWYPCRDGVQPLPDHVDPDQLLGTCVDTAGTQWCVFPAAVQTVHDPEPVAPPSAQRPVEDVRRSCGETPQSRALLPPAPAASTAASPEPPPSSSAAAAPRPAEPARPPQRTFVGKPLVPLSAPLLPPQRRGAAERSSDEEELP